MLKFGYLVATLIIFFSQAAKVFALGGLTETGRAMGYSSTVDLPVPQRIGLYVGVAISFLGVLFLAYAIYGGYLWMTAQGDEKKVNIAKDILTRATIGLIIIVSAYAITSFVGGLAFGIATTPEGPPAAAVTE